MASTCQQETWAVGLLMLTLVDMTWRDQVAGDYPPQFELLCIGHLKHRLRRWDDFTGRVKIECLDCNEIEIEKPQSVDAPC